MTQHPNIKAAKEAFVTGLSGTSKLEIFVLIATLSLSIVVCEHIKSRQHPGVGLALELLLIICPQLLVCSSALSVWPTLASFALAASACFLWDATHPRRALRHDLPSMHDLAGRSKSFVGIFRGALMAATCLCILAVDFHAFPRRYAKTEAYGTGFMDVGVGGVVLAAGLVSPAGLPVACDGEDAADGGGGRTEEGGCNARSRWRRAPHLWVRPAVALRPEGCCGLLGVGPGSAANNTNCGLSGEYGVHWNFFDTIAVVALLGHAVALPPSLLAPAAVAVTAGHQAALSLGGLGPWVMSSKRGDDLLSLNKEGLVSCLGFWALYLWGAALAHAFHVSVQPAVRHLRRKKCADGVGGADDSGYDRAVVAAATRERRGRATLNGGLEFVVAAAAMPLVRWWMQFVLLDGLLWVAVAALEAKVEPISRRSCNAAYIMWIVAQCLAGMLPLALWQALATAAAASFAVKEARNPPSTRPGPRFESCPGSGSIEGHGHDENEAGDDKSKVRGDNSAGQLAGSGGGCGSSSGALMQLSHPWWSSGPSGTVSVHDADVAAVARRGLGKCGPRVLQAINSNQLAVFLAANVMTGAVNLSCNTLQIADWLARALLGAYMMFVCGLALVLDVRGWRLKL